MKKIIGLFLSLSGIFLYVPAVKAQGGLIIIPRRVVFEAQKRTQELNLANTGTDTARFVISVIQYRMKEDGSFENITLPDSGQNFADKNFRFFPRTVVLAPNESQLVKVQITNTTELKPGEYRSHLYFRAVPKEAPLGEKIAEKDDKSISVHLTPIFGISIPIIIRTGASTTVVAISKASLETNASGVHQLKMAFSRSGNMSAYGDIKVEHISPLGKTTQVGLAKGFAIYTPIPGRQFTLNLDANQNIDYHKGKLHIVYATASDDTKFMKIAETELVLH